MFNFKFSEENFQDLVKAISVAGTAIFLFVRLYDDVTGG